MKSFHKSWALAAILMAALASVLGPRAAAQAGVDQWHDLGCDWEAVGRSGHSIRQRSGHKAGNQDGQRRQI